MQDKCLWISPGLNEPCNLNYTQGVRLANHVTKLHLFNLKKPYTCYWQTCVQNPQNEVIFDDENSFLEHVKSHWKIIPQTRQSKYFFNVNGGLRVHWMEIN